MAYGYEAPLPQSPLANILKSIQNADGTSDVTIFTAGSEGATLEMLQLKSSSASSKTVIIKITSGAVTEELGRITVPANQGHDGATPAINVLESLISGWNGRQPLIGPSCVVKASVAVALSSGEKITFAGEGWTYTA